MNTQQKGFTLIELLIVLGILGTLVVAVLVTLNPGEAQKKARDQKRMRDLATLQTIIEQYISDGGVPICEAAECNSGSADAGKQSQSCAVGNWIGPDLCRYAKSIPLDPSNNVKRNIVIDGSSTESNWANYILIMSGSDYEINARQESKSNAGSVVNDGGNSNKWVEVGTDLTLRTN